MFLIEKSTINNIKARMIIKFSFLKQVYIKIKLLNLQKPQKNSPPKNKECQKKVIIQLYTHNLHNDCGIFLFRSERSFVYYRFYLNSITILIT